MADTTQQVDIELKATDSASRVVRNIGKATGRLLTSVDKITKSFSGLMGRYGGIGTALSLGASVNSAKKYFDQIERIKNVAGGTANEIASVRYAMKGAGISAADMEASYVTLAKKGGEMNANMAGANKLARRMGVDFRKGPVESLVQMSKHLKAGKLGYKDLNVLGGESMLRMRKFLQQGPKVIRQQFAEAKKKMGHVNNETLAAYGSFKKGVGKISQAWQRMVVIVGAKLLPILTKLMDGVAKHLDSWADGAAKFGDFLVTHMDTVVTLAKVFGKIMMANYVLMKLTGEGLSGNMNKMLSMARGKKGGGAGAAASFIGPVQQKGGKVRGAARKIGAVFAVIGKKMAGVGRVFARLYAGLAGVWKTIGMFARFTIIGLVVTSVISGIKQILKDTDGIRTRLGKMLKSIWANIKIIGESVSSFFGPGSMLGKFFNWLGTGFTKVLEGMLWLIDKLVAGIAVASVMISEKVLPEQAERILQHRQDQSKQKLASRAGASMGTLLDSKGPVTDAQRAMYKQMKKDWAKSGKHIGSSKKRLDEQMRLSGLAKRFEQNGTPGERPTYVQDFRGSRFDITQKFAEGFDPDRIATAFANDLSNFGEQQIQSSLLQPFTVR